ncbi:MAG TPA: phage tail protein [Pseudonocardiaceae bacterium]
MTAPQVENLGLQMRFKVSVDGLSLGFWSSCRGLAMKFNATRVDGNVYDSYNYIPDRVDYADVTLARAMNSQDSPKVWKWLADCRKQWYGPEPGDWSDKTAVIQLFDSQYQLVTHWTLSNVYPKEWHGPELDAGGGGIALETLVLGHEGFM